ncbi:septal ring lytic transglycosylase RlpA family protein [Legionella sp. PC1000]|nr:septal ring lytic transglycosylase RlpA family protein [Legionella sp. PC1000]
MYAMTAAHPTLPFATRVRVKNLNNGRTILVRITDRGPFLSNRIIDLSFAAAKKLGIKGIAPVEIEVV